MTDKIRIAMKARRSKRWIHRKFLGIPLAFLIPLIAVVVSAALVLLGPVSPGISTGLHQMNAAVSDLPAEVIWGNVFSTWTGFNVTITLNSYVGSHNTYPILAFDTGGATPCTTLAGANFALLGSTTNAVPYNFTLTNTGVVGTGISNGPGAYSATQCVFYTSTMYKAVAAGVTTTKWSFVFKSLTAVSAISLTVTAQFTQ